MLLKMTHTYYLLQVRIDANIKALFDRFDVNQSGRLDYRELRTCLHALGLDVTRCEAAEVLLSYDSDANGLMELLEFARRVCAANPSPTLTLTRIT